MMLITLSCTYFGKGNGNPLQYSWLENPVDREAWWAAVHRIAQSQTRLKRFSMHACIGEGNGNPLPYSCLENTRDRGTWWAAVYGVTQSWTWLKRLSSSSSSMYLFDICISFLVIYLFQYFVYLKNWFSHCRILRVLCMFWMQILYEIYALKNILPVGTLSFHTISTVFLKTNKQTNKTLM